MNIFSKNSRNIFLNLIKIPGILFSIFLLNFSQNIPELILSFNKKFPEGPKKSIHKFSHKDRIWNLWFNDSIQSIFLRNASQSQQNFFYLFFLTRTKVIEQHNNKKWTFMSPRRVSNEPCNAICWSCIERWSACMRESRIFLAISLFFCWFQHWPTF